MTETSVHDMDALASIAEDDCLYVEAGDGSDFGKVDVSVLRSEMLKQRHGANLQTGTTYTLVLSDAGKVVELANDDPITLTIPANGTVAFPVNTVIEVVQGGAGAVTIEITDDTLNGATSITNQWNSVLLWKRTATVWVGIPGGLSEAQVDARVVAVASGRKTRDFWMGLHMRLAATQQPGAEVTVGNTVGPNANFIARPFDDTNVEAVLFDWVVPDNFDESWGIAYIPIWSPATTNAGDVVFELRALSFAEGDAIDAAHLSNNNRSTDTSGQTVGDIQYGPEAANNAAFGLVKGEAVSFRYQRFSSSGSDNMNGDANIIGLRLVWRTEAPTEAL